jgi:hypothetical protein
MSSTILLPPRAQLCNRSCSNKHTHRQVRRLDRATSPAIVLYSRAPCSHPKTGPQDSATSPVIVLYSRDLCARLCVLAPPPSPAGFLMRAHLSRLRLFQQHLRSLVWGLGLDSLSHSSSHALSFFSPPSFHTIPFPRVH